MWEISTSAEYITTTSYHSLASWHDDRESTNLKRVTFILSSIQAFAVNSLALFAKKGGMNHRLD